MMVFVATTILLLTPTDASLKKSWCGVISKACKLAVPVGGIAGFWGCQAGTGAVAGSCEVAGGGPENPAADACAIGLGAIFDSSCLAAVWGSGVFTASACVNAMYCEWHKEEPKRPVPDPPKPTRYSTPCICNPLADTMGVPDPITGLRGDGEHHCMGSPPCMPFFANRVCDPANGHADCFAPQILINGLPIGVGGPGRRLDGGEMTTKEGEEKAPKPRSKILGGKGKKPRKHPKKDDMTCDDNEAPVRPDELKEEGDDRRRFVVGGRHCYCDDLCTWYLDCCPDCYHAHDVSDPCTDQHGPFGQAYCNDPALCGEPKICAGCAYWSWIGRGVMDQFDQCFTPQDPCTQQHGAAGWLTCKSRGHCGAPAFCQFCEYDWGTDHCYMPGTVTPSCAAHYLCSSSLSGCESYTDKDHCLYLKMLSGELTDVGSCGQCMKENYGLIPNRNVLEDHHESHEAYCLMWDCKEEFKDCFGAFNAVFPSHEKHNGDTTQGAMFACVRDLSARYGDVRCNSCLAKYQ